MDLHAYHHALNLGFSESEASRIGDAAWENNRQQPTCDSEPEPDYYDVLVAENTRLLATITRLRAACKEAMSNMGVPQPGYLAPIAEAYRILEAALAALEGGE